MGRSTRMKSDSRCTPQSDRAMFQFPPSLSMIWRLSLCRLNARDERGAITGDQAALSGPQHQWDGRAARAPSHRQTQKKCKFETVGLPCVRNVLSEHCTLPTIDSPLRWRSFVSTLAPVPEGILADQRSPSTFRLKKSPQLGGRSTHFRASGRVICRRTRRGDHRMNIGCVAGRAS
jgi:hypothetical protein